MKESILKTLVNEDKQLSQKMSDELVNFVNAHGGFIDMRDNTGDKDDCWVVIYNEGVERYQDYLVNAVAVFDNEICVLATDGSYDILEGEKDELLESDDWMSIRGGMCWINASFVSIAEVIEQYV